MSVQELTTQSTWKKVCVFVYVVECMEREIERRKSGESELAHEHTRRAAVDVVREKGRGKAMAVSAEGAPAPVGSRCSVVDR